MRTLREQAAEAFEIRAEAPETLSQHLPFGSVLRIAYNQLLPKWSKTTKGSAAI